MKAIIFDLDGTLINTLDDLTDAVNHALGVFGREGLSAKTIRSLVGDGVKRLVERAIACAGGGIDFEKCFCAFTEFYGAHCMDKTALYPGVGDMLSELKRRGIKLAVVTNKYDEAAQELKRALFPCVDAVIGARDGLPPKPAPDGVFAALSALGAAREDALYVGDGETDIATARNAGLKVAAVTWGFRDRAVLEPLRPDILITEPSELISLVGRE